MGLVDLHSHVLPALDDGATSAEVSLRMLRGLSSLGFDVVTATPHQKAGQFMPSREAIDRACAGTRAALADAEVPIQLGLAAENMWDAVFFERSATGQIPSYNGGPAFLFELPIGELPAGLTRHLFALRAQGLLPVLAHPERYPPLWSAPDVVDSLRGMCAFVVDLGAAAGYHGRREAKAARRMLQRGVAHAAATDVHTAEDVRVAAAGIAWIRKKLGERAVVRLLDEAPRRILAGEHPDD